MKRALMTEREKNIQAFKAQSSKKGDWEQKARFEEENRRWLDRSYAIAIELLEEIHQGRIDREGLRKELDCSRQYLSKLLKGKENLTLRTISKLEKASGKALMHVVGEERFEKEDGPVEEGRKKIRFQMDPTTMAGGSVPAQYEFTDRSEPIELTPKKGFSEMEAEDRTQA